MLSQTLSAVRLAYRERRYLLKNPDVLGYGVGYRIRGGSRTDEPALVTYVREGLKSRTPDSVPRHRRIPTRVNVPGHRGRQWLPVDLVEVGVAELCQDVVTAAVTVCNCASPVKFGTVGWIALQADGTPVFCSCYHVLLPEREFFDPPRKTQTFFHNPNRRQDVTCPSPDFGGSVEKRLGVVMRGVRSPTMDFAIAEAAPGVSLADFVQAIGPMGEPRILRSQQNQPGQGEKVFVAVGHHGPISGHILEFPATFVVEYPDFPEYTMENLISTTAEVRPGDSGALLLDEGLRPLGMLIARDPQNRRSYFMPIAAAMGLNLRPFRNDH